MVKTMARTVTRSGRSVRARADEHHVVAGTPFWEAAFDEGGVASVVSAEEEETRTGSQA